MEQVDQYTPDTPAMDPGETPLGDHPLEVAARRGIGPLSPLAHDVWHGDSMPCVSCGQLVRRGTLECEDCGQDLSGEMLERMRAHAGPWYVLEHLRPFPGVSLERIIKQIRRGLITEVSIVRGPSTDYQWRYAVETPGICRYFGKCWHCHHEVAPADTYCPACLSYLSFEKPAEPRTLTRSESLQPALADPAVQPIAPAVRAFGAPSQVSSPGMPPGTFGTAPASAPTFRAQSTPAVQGQSAIFARPGPQSMHPAAIPGGGAAELARLADAVQAMDRVPRADEPTGMRAAHAGWIGAAFLGLAVLLLIWATSVRSSKVDPAKPDTITPQAATRTIQSP